MQEQGFPGEDAPPAQQKAFVLGLFEIDKLSEGQKVRAKPFQELAKSMHDWLPDGTVKTTLLERLLDMRDITIKGVR